jgi:hypothetical protein
MTSMAPGYTISFLFFCVWGAPTPSGRTDQYRCFGSGLYDCISREPLIVERRPLGITLFCLVVLTLGAHSCIIFFLFIKYICSYVCYVCIFFFFIKYICSLLLPIIYISLCCNFRFYLSISLSLSLSLFLFLFARLYLSLCYPPSYLSCHRK